MSINWFTFVAQIINFIVILYLLKRFLYEPVLGVMREREADIAARFKDAEEKAEQAKNESERYQQAFREMEAERADYLAEAEEEAQQRRSDLIHAAREEVDQMQANWYASVEHEKARFLLEVRTRMGDAVYHIAKDALNDLADRELEEAVVRTFILKVQEESKELNQQDSLASELDNADNDHVIIVRSAYELSPELEKELEKTLSEIAITTNNEESSTNSPSVAFHHSPDLICGIETEFNNRRIAWSLRDYLESYAQHLDAMLGADLSVSSIGGDSIRESAANGILPG